MDEDGDRVLADPPPYVAETHRCQGCADLDRLGEHARKRIPDVQKPGLGLRLVPWGARTLPDHPPADDEADDEDDEA